MAILSPLFYWPEYGSMFTAPAVASAETKANDTGSEATTATPAESTAAVASV